MRTARPKRPAAGSKITPVPFDAIGDLPTFE